jgi:anaerobic ribonucleoside-triphosphate reductase activating protein
MLPTIRLARVVPGSRANGPGLRDVFWTAGCSIHCPGCINPQWLDPSSGIDLPVSSVLEMLELRQAAIEGITFSGGEPTEQPEPVAEIAEAARRLGLTVLLFTGRTFDACRSDPLRRRLIDACDIVVAGPYLAGAPDRRPLVGSANQRIHFVTGRYTQEDLHGIPDAEVIVDGSRLIITGLYSRVI